MASTTLVSDADRDRAVAVLVSIAENEGVSPEARITAASTLLQYAIPLDA